jgi:acetyl-CoA synthetase
VYDAESRAWFQGGLTNAALNALDRHLPERAQQVALLTLDGEGTLEKWTYRELHDLSTRLAGVLKDLGVGPGDRVALYLPTGVEAAIAMLAAARLGAVHMALPMGLGPEALRQRLLKGEARLLIAADGYYLRGRFAPTRAAVEAALSGLDPPVLWHRRGTTEFLERAMEGKPQEALPVPSSHPSSSSTPRAPRARPKGWSTATGVHGGRGLGPAPPL